MNKKLLTLTLLFPLLGGCEPNGQGPCNHLDENPKDHVCDICGLAISEHEYGDWEKVDKNNHKKTCACGDTITEPHNWGNGVITKEPSYTEFGERTYTCSDCNATKTEQVAKLIRTDWTDEQKEVFAEHLYEYELPYSIDGQVYWDDQTSTVVVVGEEVDLEGLTAYANKIVLDGFTLGQGAYENTFRLIKEFDYKGSVKTIVIDLFAVSGGYITVTGEGEIMAVCYDPFIYEWPEETVISLLEDYFYIASDVDVPSIEADRYAVDTSNMNNFQLAIYCTSQSNLESAYKTLLEEEGFVVSGSRDESGYYVASDTDEIVQVLFQYLSATKEFLIVIEQYPGWPTQAVDYYLKQLIDVESTTTIPRVTGADSYRFIDSSWDTHGYFFVLCECSEDLEPFYEGELAKANYTLYNDDRNSNNAYAAVSENQDILIQYSYLVTESQFGNDDYKQFDVMFEPFYPHNDEHMAIALDTICKDTETVIPAYPGLGEKITISDNNINVFVTIQSATKESVKTYLETLKNAGWFIKTNDETYYEYTAVSPNKDIQLKTSVSDGRICLTISKYSDEYKNWPTAGIQEILNTLDLEGTIPEFEGGYGFTYENNDRFHDIICFVSEGDEAALIEAYCEKLISNDWVEVTDGDLTYYVKDGYTTALTIYTEREGSGNVFINISYGDTLEFDIDARAAFREWKATKEIESSVYFPGINITEEVLDTRGYYDDGETYSNYYLFEMLVDIENPSKDATIAEIIECFTNDGWEYSATDELYHKEDMFMTCYEWEGSIAIDVCSPIPQYTLTELVKKFLEESSYNSVAVPNEIVISKEYTYTIETYKANHSTPDLYLFLNFASNSSCSTAKGEIKALFEAKGWKTVNSTTYTVTLQDPTESLELYLKNDGKKLHFEITYVW